MWWLNRNKKSIFILTLIILFSMPSVFSLFHPGFFPSDDGEWMIIRFSAFHEAIRDGQIPVRFLSRLNHGYGYPVANFLYPGFMYLAESIHLLGFGFVDSIKAILILSMVGSAVFCYLWLSKFFDKLSSIVGALFYLYTPYHLFDLYKRGSVGEILALAVIPFLLWQLERRSFFWTSLGIGFLVLSHNTLAILFLAIIFAYIIIRYRLPYQLKIYWYTCIFAVGLGLSAFFWIPAIFDLRYTVFSQTQVSNWNNYFSDLSLIGVLTLLVLLLTVVFFITSKIRISKHRLTLLLLIVGLVSIFFAISLSAPLWKILPVSFIQFPFRFLALTIICVAFLASVLVDQLKGGQRIITIIIFFIFLAFSAMPYMKPAAFFDKGDSYYATNEDTTAVQNEYMPKWVKRKPVERFVEKVEIVEGAGTVKNVSYNSKKITFDVSSIENTKVRVNTIYYPGWKAYIDKKSTNISYTNDKGVIEINVRSGRHLVEVSFGETPIRLIADAISLVSFVILFSMVGIRRHKRRIIS